MWHILSSRGFHWVTTGKTQCKTLRILSRICNISHNCSFHCLNNALPESLIFKNFTVSPWKRKKKILDFLFLRLPTNFNDCGRTCLLWSLANEICFRGYVYEPACGPFIWKLIKSINWPYGLKQTESKVTEEDLKMRKSGIVRRTNTIRCFGNKRSS